MFSNNPNPTKIFPDKLKTGQHSIENINDEVIVHITQNVIILDSVVILLLISVLNMSSQFFWDAISDKIVENVFSKENVTQVI